MRTRHAPDVSNAMIQLHLMIYIAVRERQLLLKHVKNTTRSTMMDWYFYSSRQLNANTNAMTTDKLPTQVVGGHVFYCCSLMPSKTSLREAYMIFGNLTIGPGPDFTIHVGKILLHHRMMVRVIKNGRWERKRGISNSSLAGLIKSIHEIRQATTPNGNLAAGKTVFAVCHDPSRSTVIMLHPKWHQDMNDGARLHLLERYNNEFKIKQPSP